MLCAWFAAGSFVERRRRAGDLLRRRARGRQQAVGRFLAALRRGWQQAVVRLLAALEAQRNGSDGSVRGHRSGRGFCDFVGKTAGTDLSRGRKGRPVDVIKDFVPSGSSIAPYKEFISRRATDGHFVKANGRFSKANAFVKGDGRFIKADGRFIKANGYLASRPMAILSRPMAVLSRGATLEPG